MVIFQLFNSLKFLIPVSINQGSNTLHSPKANSVVKVVVNTPLRRSFDYLPPEDLSSQLLVGLRVRVPFGKRELIGLIINTSTKSNFDLDDLKRIIEVIDQEPVFDTSMMKLFKWAASYYHYPLGQVIHNAMPAHVRKGKVLTLQSSSPAEHEDIIKNLTTELVLNKQQEQVKNSILKQANGFHCFLLEGVTGSGKTEVYMQLIAEKIRLGLQVIMLVPEISLTPQTIQHFQGRFADNIVAIHSGLTDKQRFNAWSDARIGDADIIIGTRSAIFTPLLRPGLIIIDEEHDASYKQHGGFRYSARDLAIYRAQLFDVPIILGSATPSLESLHNALSNRYSLLSLELRAALASTPTFSCIDLKGKTLSEGFSEQLLDAIKEHLQQNKQVLIFLNRRGYAPLLQCHDCGWTASCPRCDTSYTLHRNSPELRCHRCESQRKIIHACPSCHSNALLPIGLGTERTEKKLEETFPDVPIFRIDRDTTRNRSKLENTISEINKGEAAIMVGTQMLAKGHHFPEVTLVAVLDADAGLFSSDFRGQEFMGQLLIQVAGRSGRGETAGEVLIQTHNSTHPTLNTLINNGYKQFSRTLLEQREMANLPPFSYQALIRAEASKVSLPMDFLQAVKDATKQKLTSSIFTLGPLPAPMEKRAGRFRFQLLLQSSNRAELHTLLNHLVPVYEALPLSRKVRWSIDVDPLDFS
jgi:primosomal protein N' (replication factor Y) (superfamily II helicase)